MKKKLPKLLLIIVICIIGILFLKKTVKIYIPQNSKPVLYIGAKGESDIDTIWCGTFQLAWNELIEKLGKNVEFENYNSELANKLNEKKFTKDMLSEDSYYIKVGNTSPNLKQEIIRDIKNKFGNKKSQFLDNIDFENPNGIIIYTALSKKFEFLEEFDDLESMLYGNSGKKVRHFGITSESDKKLYKNVEIMFYEWKDKQLECAVKLKTKEDEEIILAKINNKENFDEIYNYILELENNYEDSKELREEDLLWIPYINLNFSINYDELCGKEIKNTRKMD